MAAVLLFAALSFFALRHYQVPVWDYPEVYRDINAYWEGPLQREKTPFTLGAHFWEDGELYFAHA